VVEKRRFFGSFALIFFPSLFTASWNSSRLTGFSRFMLHRPGFMLPIYRPMGIRYAVMRIPAIHFLLFMLFSSLAFAQDFLSVDYIRTVDGDTIIAEVQGERERIRLIGIDCPESDQEWGMEATALTAGFCSQCPALQLEMDVQERDRYGRLLAYIWCGRSNIMLNEALVAEGLALLATYPPNVRHVDRFKHALQVAKDFRTGFWREGGLDMTPKEWRKR